MLNPSRLSSLISSTSFPLNRCRPSSGSQSWGYTTRQRRWGTFKRHYGDFCTGADTCSETDPLPGLIACELESVSSHSDNYPSNCSGCFECRHSPSNYKAESTQVAHNKAA